MAARSAFPAMLTPGSQLHRQQGEARKARRLAEIVASRACNENTPRVRDDRVRWSRVQTRTFLAVAIPASWLIVYGAVVGAQRLWLLAAHYLGGG